MKQKVNIYSHFQTGGHVLTFLTWKRFWIFNTLLISTLLIIYIFMIWDYHNISTEKNNLAVEVNALEKTLVVMKNTYPPFLFSADATQALTQLQKELQAQKRILAIVTSPTSFSKNMITIASLVVPNVWLTKISIYENAQKILLTGNSTTNAALEDFIHKISLEKFYADYTVNVSNIEMAADTKILLFEISLDRK